MASRAASLASVRRRDYSARTRRSPRSTSRIRLAGNCPAQSDRSDLLSVTRAVTLSTESLGNTVAEAGRNTFPGITARLVFDVITAVSTVASRLSLYGSD